MHMYYSYECILLGIAERAREVLVSVKDLTESHRGKQLRESVLLCAMLFSGHG